ncbi:hypothetical protein DMENIID0001_139830 [Sergentomyia squamirostris]
MENLDGKMLYQETLERINTAASFLGIDFILRDIGNPVSIRGYIMLSPIVLSLLCTAYTIIHFRDNLQDVAFGSVTLGVILIVLTKITVLFKLKKCAHAIIAEIKSILNRVKSDPVKSRKMFVGIKAFRITYNTFCIGYFGTVAIMLCLSIGVCIYEREKLLFLGFILPYFDHEQSPGYEINFLCHTIECVIGVGILAIFDGFVFGHMFIACMHYNILIDCCTDFNTLLTEDDELTDEKSAENCIMRLLTEHQSHIRMMRHLSDFATTHHLCLVLGDMIIIILTIFVLVENVWIPGVFLLLTTVVNLFLLSCVGTIYIIYAEMFQEAIYNCKWYCFPPKIQKALTFVLYMSQNPIQPSIGGFTGISMATFMKVSQCD